MSVTVYHSPVLKVVLFGIHVQYFQSVFGGQNQKCVHRTFHVQISSIIFLIFYFRDGDVGDLSSNVSGIFENEPVPSLLTRSGEYAKQKRPTALQRKESRKILKEVLDEEKAQDALNQANINNTTNNFSSNDVNNSLNDSINNEQPMMESTTLNVESAKSPTKVNGERNAYKIPLAEIPQFQPLTTRQSS